MFPFSIARDEIKLREPYQSFRRVSDGLESWEDWGGKRAIPLRVDDYPQEGWEKTFLKQYDHDIRRVELMKLRKEQRVPLQVL